MRIAPRTALKKMIDDLENQVLHPGGLQNDPNFTAIRTAWHAVGEKMANFHRRFMEPAEHGHGDPLRHTVVHATSTTTMCFTIRTGESSPSSIRSVAR
jgi:hypothetical protein